MSEDQTRAPSRRRRQMARERGLVARSPELTAAAGLLAAASLLGAWGDDLVAALMALVREAWTGPLVVAAGADEVVARLRHQALGVAMPLGAILGGIAAAMVAAHQAQVGGLWVPGLLAPDPARLWGGLGGRGGDGLAGRFGRGAWAAARAMILGGVAAWSIRSHLGALDRPSGLPPAALARAAGGLLSGLAWALAPAALALGAVDYLLQWRRLEAQLQQTPQEHREEQRAVDGDPDLRARRLRAARARRDDPARALEGAALVLEGPGGLTVVLGGGPPPRRVTVRAVGRGATGTALRRAAERAGLARLDAPELALGLARRPARDDAPDGTLMEALADSWPGVATPPD